jgi:5,10-methylenetetrahydromethanopterin reductase
LQLAARVADGVILSVGSQPEVVQAAVRLARAGALQAGRPKPNVVAWVPISASSDGAAARAAVRAYVTAYRGNAGARAENWVIAGTYDECRAKIRRLADTGIDQLAIVPYPTPDQDVQDLVAVFAELGNAALLESATSDSPLC